ncbi:hypothetical protein PHYPO_G00083160 [Pangasianodon hypophthalmus]|uniref:Uncharacterized protein n=1 Tax=Pangasianodon hypophthalmus TaxID=310915 RepID=A0A5N5LLR3_PANHP|nr:hypothetical protein PHYPO_G00083160 [Pangasianodon hypophthalmus]
MWGCKRFWLLFIVLLYLKDGRAFGVWRKRPAQDWYSVVAKTPLDQLQETASFPNGAQTSTATRDENETNAGGLQTSIASQAGLSSSEALTNGSFGQYKPVFQTVQGSQSQNIVSYVQATSNQDVPPPGPQNIYGAQSSGQSSYLSSVNLQSGNTVHSPLHQQSPPQQFASTFQTRPLVMLLSPPQSSGGELASASPQSSYGSQYSSTSQYALQGVGQSVSHPQIQARLNTLFGQSPSRPLGATSAQQSRGSNSSSSEGTSVFQSSQPQQNASSYSGSQRQSSMGYGLSQGLASQYGGGQSSSAPAFVAQQASESATFNGSTSSTSSSYSGFQHQTSTGYGLSHWLASRYGSFQTQDGSHLSSAPALTVTQQASETGMSSGPTTSGMSSSSHSGSQSPSTYWLSLGLSSPYGSFQTQHGINQHGSVPGLSVIQPASESAMSSGSTSSTSGSYSGSQSQGSTFYGVFHGLSSPYSSFQPQQGINQLGSAPALTVPQQVSEDATTANGSSTSSLSSSYTGSQSPAAYWLSLRLSSQYVGSQGQQGVNQLGSMIRPAPESAVSSGSTSSTSSSYSGSQSQGSSGYGLSQGLVSQYGGQSSSVPALTVIQQASASAVLNGSTTSSSYSGSQSPGSTVYGLNQVLASPYGSFQTQQGTFQLSPAPALTVTQQATEGATTANGSSTSSLSSSYTGSQSPTAYWLSLSRIVGSDTQQGVNHLGSVPGLTVIQPASESAMSTGSTSSTSSSYSGSQSQSASGYGPSRGFSNPDDGSRTPEGIQLLSSAPALTVNQQASESTSHGSSNSNTSSTYSASQSHSLSQGLAGSSLGIPSQSVQKLGAFNQLVPARCFGQQPCKKTVFSGSSSNFFPKLSW